MNEIFENMEKCTKKFFDYIDSITKEDNIKVFEKDYYKWGTK